MTVKVLPRYTKEKYTSRRHTKGVTFIKDKAYTVHGFYSEMSSTTHDGMSYVILVNEYRELWWVCNRHVRVVDEGTDGIILKYKHLAGHRTSLSKALLNGGKD